MIKSITLVALIALASCSRNVRYEARSIEFQTMRKCLKFSNKISLLTNRYISFEGRCLNVIRESKNSCKNKCSNRSCKVVLHAHVNI